MRVYCHVASEILLISALLSAPFSHSQSTVKKKVTNQADLPRFSYPVTRSASDLVQADDATFGTFAAKVRADLDSVFRGYEIDDKATLRTLLSAKLELQQLAGEYPAALKTVDSLRALEEKPSAKLTTGLLVRAFLQAAIDTNSASGTAYEQAFSTHYREAIDSLPWDVVQDNIKASYAGSRVFTKAVAIGQIKTDLDPAVQKSGSLDNSEAWDLISARNLLRFAIPLGPARAEVLKQYIAVHNIVKPDIWAAREVTLAKDQKLTPVWSPFGILAWMSLSFPISSTRTRTPRRAVRMDWPSTTVALQPLHGYIR